MNLTGTCQCGQPITGIVRSHREGSPPRESWTHTSPVSDPHSATPAQEPGPDPSVILHPDVEVTLVGENGNILHLVAVVARALRRAGHRETADALPVQVMAAGSYDEALAILQRTVNVK